MTCINSAYNYHSTPADVTLDSTQTGFTDVDETSAVLDSSILDSDDMQPHDSAYRKDSLAGAQVNGVISPAESQNHSWDPQFSAGLTSEPMSAISSQPFHDDGRSYMQSSQPAYIHPHQGQTWSMEVGGAMTTFGAEYMHAQQPFGAVQYVAQPINATPIAFDPSQATVHYPISHPEASFATQPPQIPSPLSPQPLDHMALAAQEVDSRPSRRLGAHTPQTSIIEARQGDGVRKKNNRIDIPAGRNINNIDQLIENETDENLIRELKSQKRLLRNREAALQSRQRKKKHTEDLEIKEKQHAIEASVWQRDRAALESTREELSRAQGVVESLERAQREMIMRHTEETNVLRRQIQHLQEQLETGPAPAMSAVPSSTGYAELNAGVQAMNFGSHDNLGQNPWDDFIFPNNLAGDCDDYLYNDGREMAKHPQAIEKKASTATLVPNMQQKKDSTVDQPIVSGLLFMLLLCGAFVASKPPESQPAGMPTMPAEVQAAAPAVLKSLLAESDLSTTLDTTHASASINREPAPSAGMPAPSQQTRMDHVYRSLTAPTRQQELDQAFSLTPTQYASITSDDYALQGSGYNTEAVNPDARPRRNLAEALATLEQEHLQGSKAEVYTRSLLWERIPRDVVQQFKEMVRDHNQIEARQQAQGTNPSEGLYKLES